MNPVVLNIERSRVIGEYNFLYRSRHPDYLVQDIVSIVLSTGYRIEVSWWPEHDPTGRYYLAVLDEHDGSEVEPPLELSSVDEVLQVLHLQVQRFSAHVITFSFATDIGSMQLPNCVVA